MKWLRILAIFFLIVAVLPLAVFCADHHDGNGHPHCVLVCHASCHSLIVPVFESSIYPGFVSVFSFRDKFFYQDPTLDTFKRPPVFSVT